MSEDRSDKVANENVDDQAGKDPDTVLNIMMQYIKDISVESPAAPACFNQFSNKYIDVRSDVDKDKKGLSYDVSVGIDVAGATPDNHLNLNGDKGADYYEVSLTLKVNSRNANDMPAYIIELKYCCVVMIKNYDASMLDNLLNVYIPDRFLLPAARPILRNLLFECGFQPVIISPIDFDGLLKKKIEQKKLEEESN